MPPFQTSLDLLKALTEVGFSFEKKADALSDVWTAGPIMKPRPPSTSAFSSMAQTLAPTAHKTNLLKRFRAQAKPFDPSSVGSVSVRHLTPTPPPISAPPFSTAQSLVDKAKGHLAKLDGLSRGKKLAYGAGAALTGLAAYKALKHYQRSKQKDEWNSY